MKLTWGEGSLKNFNAWNFEYPFEKLNFSQSGSKIGIWFRTMKFYVINHWILNMEILYSNIIYCIISFKKKSSINKNEKIMLRYEGHLRSVTGKRNFQTQYCQFMRMKLLLMKTSSRWRIFHIIYSRVMKEKRSLLILLDLHSIQECSRKRSRLSSTLNFSKSKYPLFKFLFFPRQVFI